MTDMQLAILKLIVKGNDDGSHLDIDQIVERLGMEYSHYTTKQSLQFSLRFMRRDGLIEKHGYETRRKRRRVLYAPTLLGFQMVEEQIFPGRGERQSEGVADGA